MFYFLKKYKKITHRFRRLFPYRFTRATLNRLAILVMVILLVSVGWKYRNIFDHTVNNDLKSQGIYSPSVSSNFFALPAYGVTKTNGQFQFENGSEKNDGIRISMSESYSGPVEVALGENRSIRIFDENGSGFKSDMLKSFNTEKKAESDKYVKYKSADGRKTVYYSYQKDAKNGTNKLKNWVVYKSGTGEEKETYKIENANLALWQGGAVAVFYADKFTDEEKNRGGEKIAKGPDLLIDRPYYLDKDGKAQMLGWKINEKKNEISVEFSTDRNSYPITLDPTITHNTKDTFDAGTAFNRTESITGPKVQSSYHELPADKSTVGLWHMNETSNDSCSGGQDACDSSGNGNHGTATGAFIDTTNQKLGAAARSFNGSSDYISVTDSALLKPANLTVEAWVYANNLSSDWMSAVQKTSSGSRNDGYGLSHFQGTNDINFWVNNYSSGGVASGTLPIGQWVYVAGTYDGTTVKLYFNGQLVSSVSYSTSITHSTNALYVGSGTTTGGAAAYYWSGKIDEVRISNIARSAEEIKADAQRFAYGIYSSSVIDLGVGATSISKINWTENGVTTGDGETVFSNANLAAQWNFNEASGTTANNDAEGSSCGGTPANCDGTLTSFVNTTGRDIGGTAVGSGWTADNRRWGAGGLMFDGNNDYVNAGTASSLSLTGDVTIEVWINPAASQNAYATILSKHANGGFSLEQNNANTNQYYFAWDTNGSGNWTGTSIMTSLTPGVWQHFVIIKNGTTVTHYVNGVQTATGTGSSSTISTNALALKIGDVSSSSGRYFRGIMDSVRIYSRSLSAEEILSNYNAGNIDIQTRTGANSDPDDGSWETWKPAGTETQILSLDSDGGSWPWDNTATYIPATTANESNIKMEGAGSLKIKTGTPKADANTVGLWHLDETGAGVGATAYDSSGNGYNMMVGGTGVSLVDGISGKAKSFPDSASSYLSVASNLGLGTTNTTMEAWVNLDSTSESGAFIKAGTGNGYGIGVGSSSFYDAGNDLILNYEGVRWIDTNTAIGVGWHHVAMTINSSGYPTAYIDGAQVYSDTTGAPSAPTGTSYIGGYTNGANQGYVDAYIDEVRISKAARSAEEIAEAYRFGRDHTLTRTISSADLSAKNKLPFYVAADRPGTYMQATVGESAFSNYEPDANTGAFWHLDEGISRTTESHIKDSSSNGNNGSLYSVSKTTFTTAGTTPFVVPEKVTSITVKAWGAGGGGGGAGYSGVGGSGGGGGYSISTLSVTPGETLNIHIGGSGGGGPYNSDEDIGSGGGAGGRSYVSRSGTMLIVAGGGGGGGGGNGSYSGGQGGPGGGTTGTAGSNSTACGGGGGGTQSSVGVGGTGCVGNGSAGSSSAGGDGGSADSDQYYRGRGGITNGGDGGAYYHRSAWQQPTYNHSGGGGGGEGYYGGGGGCASNNQQYGGGGGGGGSSYLTGTSSSTSAGSNSVAANNTDSDYADPAGDGGTEGTAGKNGRIVISYTSTSFGGTGGKIGWARGGFGTANSTYINAGSNPTLNPSTAQTASAWVYPTGSQTGAGEILCHCNGSTDAYQFYVSSGTAPYSVTMSLWNTSGTNYYVTSPNIVQEKKWTHVAGVFDSSSNTVKIYVNGSLQGVATTSGTLRQSAINVYLGVHGSSPSSNYFTGSLDEVRLDSVARTADEIRQAYEFDRRSHPITIDFAASLDSGNLISGTADTSFTIDSTTYGAASKGSNIYAGDKIIVRENYGGTEYMAQGTVSSVNVSTGAISVLSWDAGSTAPSGGYTTGAVLFKWQREYWDITGPIDGHIDAITKLTLRQTDGNEGRTIYLDDFKTLDNYLTAPTAPGNVSSSFNRYFQYRVLFSSSDKTVSSYISSVNTIYANQYGEDTNTYKSRGTMKIRGNAKMH